MQLIDNVKDAWQFYSVRLQVMAAIMAASNSFLTDGDWRTFALLAVVNVLSVFGRVLKQSGVE